MPGLTLIALVGVLALWLAVAVPATGTVSAQTTSTDATLSSLTLSDVVLGAPATLPGFGVIYTGTAANAVTETTVTATTTDSNATVAITLGSDMYSNGDAVPLAVGANSIFVVVTAEDTATTLNHLITVTRALPLVVRSISPSTVVPGGTFEVTLDFDPARTPLTGVDEYLPDGFSWVPADYGRAINSALDRIDPQELELTLFGRVSTVTYQVTASDMPGVYEITGIMLTGVRITEPVIGDTQITVAESPDVTLSSLRLKIDEGGSGTYTVRLGQPPTADVTVAIVSNNTDVTVSPSSLTFTAGNWNSRQTVTVNAPQDTDHNYDTAILTHTATSTDPNYSGIPVDSVDVSVFDDDVTVMFGEAAYEVKEGEKLELPVTLSAALDINARMPLRSAFQGGATQSDFRGGGTAIFERGDTSTKISFTAVDDVIDDDDESVLFSFLTEQFLARGVSVGTPATTTVSIIDDDEPLGVTVSPTALTVGEGGMGTYTVKLDAGIDGSSGGNTVTVAIISSNTDVTVSPSSLTFTGGSMSNWNIEQTVTVAAAEDDDAADDTANLTHRPSGGGYGSGQNKTFVVTVTDDDTRGVTVTPTSLPLNEGDSGTYTVKLDTQPTATVTVTIVDPTDNTDVTTTPASLTFSTSNWATPQTVTVSAAEDDDSTQDTATVTHAVAGGDYDSFAASSVAVTVTDDDTPGVTIAPTSLTVGEGSTGTYTVKLNTVPTGDVTVAISSNNTDVTASPSSLTFTATTWNTAQTVTVTTGEDADAADDTATLTHDPSGADYASVINTDLEVTVTDDDTRGVTVTPTDLTVDEGGTGTYTVKLDTEPTATVTVTIVDPTDNADVTASPASLTFSTSNWATAQTVTVSAAEDTDLLHDTATVTHTLAGGDYAAITASSVAVTVNDNDTPGVTVSPGLLTVDEGSTDTYTVELNTQPSGDVTVAITSNNTDVTASSSSLTFTATTWNTAQTVTVTAGDDMIDEDAETVTLTHTPSGGGYGSVTAATLTVTVNDNDTRGVTVTPASLPIEEGGTATYTVVLGTEPTDTVTVTIVDPTDNADVTANPANLTFTTSNWETAQTVTVSAAEDGDALQATATVTHTVAGGDYGGVTASSVDVTVTDDDTPGVTVAPTSLTLGEGGTGTYTVVLDTLPTGNVTVVIVSNNTDVTVPSSTLTFTTTNWNSAQTVTVSAGQDDDAANDTATLTHNPSGADYGLGEQRRSWR